jgi:hypothetical protein
MKLSRIMGVHTFKIIGEGALLSVRSTSVLFTSDLGWQTRQKYESDPSGPTPISSHLCKISKLLNLKHYLSQRYTGGSISERSRQRTRPFEIRSRSIPIFCMGMNVAAVFATRTPGAGYSMKVLYQLQSQARLI